MAWRTAKELPVLERMAALLKDALSFNAPKKPLKIGLLLPIPNKAEKKKKGFECWTILRMSKEDGWVRSYL